VLARQKGQHRDGRFHFFPSAACKKKRPHLSWHLRMEEQAEIENAWNGIRTGEQVQKVSEYLGLFPVLKQTTHTVRLNEGPDLTNQRFA
jgi:hypothetical protein